MCGIVGYIGQKKKALDVLISGLEHLEYRGYDSSGIAYLLDDKLIIKKEPGKIVNLKKSINLTDKSGVGIGHTRWATHGAANKTNAHPHQYEDITIVHNGIIENYLELKNDLLEKGYHFVSETDTEVAAVLLYDIYKETKNMFKTIKRFKQKVIGTYAILIMNNDDKDSLYALKQGSPLIIGIGDDGNYLASDVLAIIKYTNKYIILDDGDYAKITDHDVIIYDGLNNVKETKVNTIDMNDDIVSKSGYSHYMLKEINEEPIVIKNTLYDNISFNLTKYKKIIVVGCGSAIYAGMVGAYLISKYADIETTVEIASEFRYKKLFLDKKTLVIAISQSGETADTLEAVKIAKEHGSPTLGIVNVRDSSIARIVDHLIYTSAGREIAVATTKAYLAQVLTLALLAKQTISDDKLMRRIDNDLKKLPVIIQSEIDNYSAYQRIARKLYDKEHIFFIGRGIDHAISLEGSLKLKEISYIHSEAYAAGELKHGTISLIEENTPVIGVVTDISIADKTISNLKEVKARGAYVIYVTTNRLYKEGDFYDDVIILKDTDELLAPLTAVVPLQLLAYYTAKLKKCDIDKPRNLAKSVTVE